MAIAGTILSVACDAVITEPDLKAASITRQPSDNAVISLRKKTGSWILAKRHLRSNKTIFFYCLINITVLLGIWNINPLSQYSYGSRNQCLATFQR